MINQAILDKLKKQVIVSCQALDNEILHGSDIMAKMAIAAEQGDAAGIRANSAKDVRAIKEAVDLPIIAIIKAVYPNSDVYITPTIKEVDELAVLQPAFIAMDCTWRKRPKETLEEVVAHCRMHYPEIMLMADCGSYRDAELANNLGFDILGTTLSGYTEETKNVSLPNISLVEQMVANFDRPVFCEGGIHTTDEMNRAFAAGAHTSVIGGAITRPNEITQYFVSHIGK
ncbi:N-acetylmannosamine-6-phosphate 2-epimerase [Enterococcus sp.]|uniref:N-acetylmannosamine-6-phosphate 2-epimerase n=1 Tax=Enterococcus sp. TaxID=35783 RepID=UPI003C766F69